MGDGVAEVLGLVLHEQGERVMVIYLVEGIRLSPLTALAFQCVIPKFSCFEM